MTRLDLERRLQRRRGEDRAAIMMLPAPWVGPALTVITIWTAIGRGWDYTRGADQTEALAFLNVFGIHAWGWCFVGMAVILTVGLVVSMWTHRIGVLLMAHGVALGVYAAFLIALLQGLFTHIRVQDDAARVFVGAVIVAAVAVTALTLWRYRVGFAVGATATTALLIVALTCGLPITVIDGPVSLRAIFTAAAGGAIHYIRLVTTARAAPARGARL
jgi:hypothetical protein